MRERTHAFNVFLAFRARVYIIYTHYAALLSQLPRLVLMVADTGLGLWIMALPIVG